MKTIFWHDYETFGIDPRRDRPCQFAGIRTDEDLNIIDDPVEIFCQPAPDFLPDPGSCAITGISPQHALTKGVPEAEFCARIAREFMEPGTCVAGYNSIRFDDDVTRHLFYRCFYDPYEREYKNGNSRWDIIDLLRMTQALRPEGINWPQNDDGSPSFRLQLLTAANGIAHVGAHDALADVRATLAMAQLVKQKQPKLYDYLFTLRDKNRVLPLLDLTKQEPVVHASRMFAAGIGCLAIVLPLARHPHNSNGIIVADLLSDPTPWATLSAVAIRERLFTPSAERAEGETRIPLKTIHLNRCPAVAPITVLTEAIVNRYVLDMRAIDHNRQKLLAIPGLAHKIAEVFNEHPADSSGGDPDFMLYSGGFFDTHDKRAMEKMRTMSSAQLASLPFSFHDSRLPEMLFRYRARNYPQTLTAEEQQRWMVYCRQHLLGEAPGAGVSMAEFAIRLANITEPLPTQLRASLKAYAEQLRQQFVIS